MRHGVPTCNDATDPAQLYIYLMYHEWFFGPFETEDAVRYAILTLDAADPYWDYDCFAIYYGMGSAAWPWTQYLAHGMRERIEPQRVGYTSRQEAHKALLDGVRTGKFKYSGNQPDVLAMIQQEKEKDLNG